MHVLVVSADPSVLDGASRALHTIGATMLAAADGELAVSIAAAQAFDVIVVDLGYDDDVIDLETITLLRASRVNVPLILIRERLDDAAIVRALDLGADDVVAKPLSAEVYVARLRAAARRGANAHAAELFSGSLVLDRLARRVSVDGEELPLTAKEFSLLEHLLLNRGRPVPRTELLSGVWQMDFDPGSNVVDVHVMRLRRKLHLAGATLAIRTLRGLGFALEEKAG
jgi:DNA-binding response OmpR family regulator